jgi:hypothetical protein
MPTDADLSKALGLAKPIWDGLVTDIAAQHGVANQDWKSYSPKAGWALRLMRGRRTILWLAPFEGSFEVLFILGDKALSARAKVACPLGGSEQSSKPNGTRRERASGF